MWSDGALTQMSANLELLGRMLEHYGPEANPARNSLREIVGKVLVATWPNERAENAKISPGSASAADLYNQIMGLTPKDDEQSLLKSQASSLLLSLGQIYWLRVSLL